MSAVATFLTGTGILLALIFLGRRALRSGTRQRRETLRRENVRLYKQIEALGVEKGKEYLEPEEDYSEEWNESRGMESSAVMDEEDEED